MTRDEKIEIISNELFDKYIPSQYINDHNRRFISSILNNYNKGFPFDLNKYFDIQNATGERLSILAFNFFSIKRAFKDIILTDSELLTLINFAIALNGNKIHSISSIGKIFYDIFNEDVNVDIVGKNIRVIINSYNVSKNVQEGLLFYDLYPRVVGSSLHIIYTSPNKKVFFLRSGKYFKYKSNQGGFNEVGKVASVHLESGNSFIL